MRIFATKTFESVKGKQVFEKLKEILLKLNVMNLKVST